MKAQTAGARMGAGSGLQGPIQWVAGTITALAVAAGVTIWQSGGQRAANLPVHVPPAPPPAVAPLVDVSAGRTATLYVLVETAERAAVERERLAEVARLQEANGVTPLEVVIAVVEEDALAGHLHGLFTHLAGIREAEGLAPLHLLDLRASATPQS